ncbi:hypothetical protein EJ110_NYTH27855 [Nymphaea thermarum]|nr:hypothetical protein EJ110_NYTH27855 [Nymphaea thermarum]
MTSPDSPRTQKYQKGHESATLGRAKSSLAAPHLPCTSCSNYRYQEILQHANGVRNSPKSLEKAAKHRALEMILMEGAEQLKPFGPPLIDSRPPKCVKLKHKEERFVWHWMAIVANIPTTLENEAYVTNGKLKTQFSEFSLANVTFMWDALGFRGMSVVEFRKKWTCFYCAISFEKSFELRCRGKTEWIESKKCDSNGTFKCPFCLGKKKQDYQYKEILQQANGVRNSPKSLEKTAKHRALEMILMEGAKQLKPSEPPMIDSRPPKHVKLEHKEEIFVWPWMAIVAHITTALENEAYVTNGKLKAQFSEFSPTKVTFMWDALGIRGMCAISFEKSFELRCRGKTEWIESKKCDSSMYAWLVQEDDYHNSDDYVKMQLHRGDLKTISELQHEEEPKKNTLIDELTLRINEKNRTCSRRLKTQFSEFSLANVSFMWDALGFRGMAVVEFKKKWTCFYCAISFEKSFELRCRGKTEWIE